MIEDRVEQIRQRMIEILKHDCYSNRVAAERAIDTNPPYMRSEKQHASLQQSDILRPWILEEWRRLSIPEWLQVLKEARDAGDATREKYALWMLNEVLEFDSDQPESEGNSIEDSN